jgi:hypothetical protein
VDLSALPTLLLIGSILLTGCHPHIERPYPPPTAEQLLSRLRQQIADVHALRGTAKVDYFSPKEGRVKAKIYLAAEASGGLRIDAVSPFGSPVSSFATDGKQFELLDVKHNHFYVGVASPCSLEELLHLKVTPQELFAALAGAAPILPIEKTEVGWDDRNGWDVLTIVAQDGRHQILKFDSHDKTWDLRESTVQDPQGKLLFKLTHQDFTLSGSIRLPKNTHFIQPVAQADVIVRYRDIDVNTTIPQNLFLLAAPNGIAPEMIVCQ